MKYPLLSLLAAMLSLCATGCTSGGEKKSEPSRISGRAGVVVSTHDTSRLRHASPGPDAPPPTP